MESSIEDISLNLSRSSLDNASLASTIAEIPISKLKSLNLSANPGLTALPRDVIFVRLERMNMSHCGCTNAMLAALVSQCRGLNNLILVGCGISALPSNIGACLNILTLLNVSGNEVNQIPSSAIKLKHLVELNLSGNRIDDSAVKIIRIMLTTTRLERLYLANNRIGASGAKMLAAGLSCGSALRLLVLTGNSNISDDGTVSIFTGIASIASHVELHTLCLEACGISDRVARSLAAAIRSSFSLRTLCLGRNRLGDEAIVSLSRALEDQRGLSGITQLDLSDNRLQADSAVALAAAILHNNALLWLNLAGNDNLMATTRAATALADGIARNKVCTSA